MLRFLSDSSAILRLRFHKAEHYRYPIGILLVAFLLLSAVNAALFAPYLPAEKPIILAVVTSITLVKWLTLALTMQIFLHYQGAPKMNLIGFILLSECLNIPMILLAYAPQLALLGMFWQFWTIWVQLKGLTYFSKINGLWIILAYIIYFIVATLVSLPVLSIFVAGGWLDVHEVLNHMEQMQNIKP